MLGFFRRRMKIILWVLVGFVIVAFVPWGAGVRYLKGGRSPRSAGKLFGRAVPLGEYNDAFKAVSINAYLTRRNLDREQINRLAWDRLMMLKEARRMGISVSDRELAAAIRRQFSSGGQFNQRFYETFLGLAGITPATYERWMRESLMIDRLLDIVRKSAWLPDAEIKRRFRDEKAKYVIRYHLVPTDELKKKVKVPEKEIEDYYGKNKNSFTAPATVNARYVLIEWAKGTENPQITDAEIEQYYKEHPENYSHGERVKARHILFRVNGGADTAKAEEKALSKAKKVLAKLRKGADFARLARKYSEDKSTREKGGELGFIERGDMPPPFSEKAFSLREGEVSEPVKTNRGYHLIMVEEIQEPGEKPLDEVKEEIRTILQKEKKRAAEQEAKRKAYSTAVDVSLSLVDTPDLEKVAKEFSLETRETGPFTERGKVGDLGYIRDLNRAAFETEPGSFSDIVEVRDRGYAIIVPKEKTGRTIKPLKEVRAEIEEILREGKARKKAREKAEREREEVLQRMRDDALDFAAACKELSLPTEVTEPFAPRGPIPGLGTVPDISRALAALPSGKVSPVFDTPKGPCFFVVMKKDEPGEEQIAGELESFRRRMLYGEGGKLAREWSRRLRERAGLFDYTSEWQSRGDNH